MDRYNIKQHSKTSEIDDDFWRKSFYLNSVLEQALDLNDNKQIKAIVNNHNLFKAMG